MIDKNTFTQPLHLRDDKNDTREGIFSIQVIEYANNPQGELIFDWAKKNLIVNNARKTLAHAIGDVEGFGVINQLRLGGDNSLDAQALLHPALPVVTDSNIVYTTNTFIRNRDDLVDGNTNYPGFSVSYPDAPNETSVLFTVRIGKTEGNLQDPAPTVYTCAGLFATQSAGLFASQSFPVVAKSSSREIVIGWCIRF